MHDPENLLMTGPRPTEEAVAVECGVCGRATQRFWVAADAVRVARDEDFEYEPGEARVQVCRDCANAIHARWLVIPDA